MRIGKIGVAVIGLVPFNVYGECTPTPDCASIGYTETSCEGDSLKCTFDTSKMKCMPCDSSFKYTCTGDNITGGTGSACGGKYVSCECTEDTFFNNGACVCDTSCTVGAIYYSDGTCSSCVDSNKTAIGVVVKDNELVMNLELHTSRWSATIGGGTDGINATNSALTDFSGKSNTQAIVTRYAEDENESVSSCAGLYCYNYAPEGMEESRGKWYLPACGEVYYYVTENAQVLFQTTDNKLKLRWKSLNPSVWTSTEHLAARHVAFWINLLGGGVVNHQKNAFEYGVLCFLNI